MNGTKATKGRRRMVVPGWRATAWGSRQPPAARRVVVLQPQVLPLGLPHRQPPGRPRLQHRFPRLLPPLMLPGCCEAGRGTTSPGTAARLPAATSTRTTASTSSVSASVASPMTNSLPFYPLILYTWLFIMGPLPLPTQTLTSDEIPPGPLSEDDLRQRWNKQADEYNQWESLDSCEQLEWAQALAIRADRHAAALCRRLEALERGANDLPAPAAPVDDGPIAAAGGLLESIARIIASDSSESPESFQGISKDVIHRVAAWLDTHGQHGCSGLLREEIDR